MWVKCGGCCAVKTNCEDLGEFMDVKRANGDSKALEETLGIFSFLLVYA